MGDKGKTKNKRIREKTLSLVEEITRVHARSGQRHMHMANYRAYIAAYMYVYTVCKYRRVCLWPTQGITHTLRDKNTHTKNRNEDESKYAPRHSLTDRIAQVITDPIHVGVEIQVNGVERSVEVRRARCDSYARGLLRMSL